MLRMGFICGGGFANLPACLRVFYARSGIHRKGRKGRYGSRIIAVVARDRRDRKAEASPQRTQERREIWGSYSKDSCQRGFTSGSMRSKASCRIAREVAKQILTCPSEPGPNQRGRPGTRATRV